MHRNLRPPEPQQSFSALITMPCQIWSDWTYPLPYWKFVRYIKHFCCWYITLCCDLDLWAHDLDLSHKRSQDFVWWVHFFLPKKLTTFSSRRLQRTSKYTSKSNRPSKNCPKNDSCSDWGCTSCPRGVRLHIFPVNYAWKIFFTILQGCMCTHCTLHLWSWTFAAYRM